MVQMMLSVRRDAVAAILMNLWVLAGGLRSKHPIPRYLPSAAIARKRLLQRLEYLEEEGFDKGSHMRSTSKNDISNDKGEGCSKGPKDRREMSYDGLRTCRW